VGVGRKALSRGHHQHAQAENKEDGS
jgi:hypothetical protein